MISLFPITANYSIYLNRFLSVVPQEVAGLKIGFGFEYEIIFRIQAAGLQIK
jgi:hypothetical protein